MVRKNTKSSRRTFSHRPKGVSDKDFKKVYWPYLPMLVITLVAFVLSNVTAQSTIARGYQRNVLAYATSMSISGLLSETNAQRGANGVASLALNSTLNASAQAKANDMASKNYWSHNTPDGSPPWIFVDAQGYSYQKIGENLATGFSTENAAIIGWMNSPSHKANMLDTSFTEVGFGFANIADYTAAGGGPQTIVVAFYGLPYKPIPASCPAGQEGTPPNCTTPAPAPVVQQSSNTTPPTSTATTESTPVATSPEPTKETTPENTQAAPTNAVPATNKTPVAVTASVATSQAGVMVSGTAAKWVTGLSVLVLSSTLLFWVARHSLAARRFIVSGENFVFHHPVVDVTVVAILAIAFSLTQTTGFIQ